MEWVSPLFAIVGVVIGSGTTLAMERSRWKRDRHREAVQVQREVFVAYLTHMGRAHEGMRLASESSHASPEDRRLAVLKAFADADLYEVRFRLTMLAPDRVVELAVHAFRKCRATRDQLAAGAHIHDDDYRETQVEYYRAVQATSDAMRRELGIPELSFVPLGFAPGTRPSDPI
ncbi:hypothetical protein D0Z67_15110 [Streptomyces seoulensis]|uniref:Uncharacterized protein n=2 Tax=Streptomyces seoulensis TaxID=73044 RepID=A0A4P6TY24_STRSO|nr:hypothetical protein D0Z67_15110 [Streptomyces seoulensis]